MNTDLLRSWLDLPPGTWPPADRELLGVGATTPAQAERRAMQLMSRLRPHQLLHPDLVTEGMNRLAQAMLSVANHRPVAVPVAPVVPPPPPVVLAKTVVLPKPRLPKFEAFDLAPQPSSKVGEPPAAPVPAAPVVLDAEVVDDEPDVPIPFARFEQLDESPTDRPAARVPTEFVAVPEVVPPHLPLPPGLSAASRRLVYRQVAALRELLRAWASLRTCCGNPTEDFDTPGRVYAIDVAVGQFHAAVRHPGFDAPHVTPLAPRVFAVFRQPSPLAIVRMLSLPQRRLLARDWALGQSQLEGRTIALRNSLRRTRPGGTISQQLSGVGRFLAVHPEWMLAPPALVLTLVALGKWVARTTTVG